MKIQMERQSRYKWKKSERHRWRDEWIDGQSCTFDGTRAPKDKDEDKDEDKDMETKRKTDEDSPAAATVAEAAAAAENEGRRERGWGRKGEGRED